MTITLILLALSSLICVVYVLYTILQPNPASERKEQAIEEEEETEEKQLEAKEEGEEKEVEDQTGNNNILDAFAATANNISDSATTSDHTYHKKMDATDLIITVDKQHEVSIPPPGWQRLLENNRIVYFSPTLHRLVNLEQIRRYLQSDRTCKCGLRCPVHLDQVFNFDASVPSMNCDLDASENTLCKHSSFNNKMTTTTTMMMNTTARTNQVITTAGASTPTTAVINNIHNNTITGNAIGHIKSGSNNIIQIITTSNNNNISNNNSNNTQSSKYAGTIQNPLVLN